MKSTFKMIHRISGISFKVYGDENAHELSEEFFNELRLLNGIQFAVYQMIEGDASENEHSEIKIDYSEGLVAQILAKTMRLVLSRGPDDKVSVHQILAKGCNGDHVEFSGSQDSNQYLFKNQEFLRLLSANSQ